MACTKTWLERKPQGRKVTKNRFERKPNHLRLSHQGTGLKEGPLLQRPINKKEKKIINNIIRNLKVNKILKNKIK